MMNADRLIKDGAKLLGALSNQKRLQVLFLLVEHEEMSVGELADRIDLSQSALSQHLGKLRQANVVSARRDAQNIYYSTRHEGVRSVLACLQKIYHP